MPGIRVVLDADTLALKRQLGCRAMPGRDSFSVKLAGVVLRG
jgi:hypothetical protein